MFDRSYPISPKKFPCKMREKEKLISTLFDKGVLLNEDVFHENLDEVLIGKIVAESDLIILTSDYSEVIRSEGHLVDWYEVDKLRVDAEKDRDEELYQSHLQELRIAHLTFKNELALLPLRTAEHPLRTAEQFPPMETLPPETSNRTINSLESSFSSSAKNISPDIFSDKISSKISSEISSEILSPKNCLDYPPAVDIVVSYINVPRKYEVRDFTRLFLSRYQFVEGILRSRQELSNVLTINRIINKTEKESVSAIGLVLEINETKNKNLIITLEDMTGRINVLFSKNKKELYAAGKDLVPDEVIGVIGWSGEKIIFGEKIIWPDIPSNREMKKGLSEEYAIFLSDIHVGSSLFLEEEFHRFLQWIKGEAGSDEQREIALNTKYIFIAGDIVDGVGVYPSQESELKIKDIKEQYAEFSNLIKLIPPEKKIIICPGNHDVVHLAEPQTAFYPEFSPALFSMPNVTLVTNPALVNIGKTSSFPGFDVLLYHGSSFDYYVANVESIRVGGGYHRSDLIMKFLLQRRHLAPSFKSTPYFPVHDEDPLLIKKIPDFFLTGHIHYSIVANYKGTTLICGSCWQSKTTFQEKLGHDPEPCRVPVVNLKTRKVKILRFG